MHEDCQGTASFAPLAAGHDEAPADAGCDFVVYDPRFGHCGTCPLPMGCRYQLPPRTARALALRLGIARHIRAGADVGTIAATLRVDRRTVYRIASTLADRPRD